MDKEVVKRIEAELYIYYETKKILQGLDVKISRLEKQKETIEYDIKNTNVNIDPYQSAFGLNERVQTSSDGVSYAEKEIIKEIDKLERERVNLIKLILDLKAEKRTKEYFVSNMECNINMLNEESKRFLELKYSDKYTNIAISNRMNMAIATVYRIKEEILGKISNFMNSVNV